MVVVVVPAVVVVVPAVVVVVVPAVVVVVPAVVVLVVVGQVFIKHHCVPSQKYKLEPETASAAFVCDINNIPVSAKSICLTLTPDADSALALTCNVALILPVTSIMPICPNPGFVPVTFKLPVIL